MTGCVLGEVVGLVIARGKGHALVHQYHSR